MKLHLVLVALIGSWACSPALAQPTKAPALPAINPAQARLAQTTTAGGVGIK